MLHIVVLAKGATCDASCHRSHQQGPSHTKTSYSSLRREVANDTEPRFKIQTHQNSDSLAVMQPRLLLIFLLLSVFYFDVGYDDEFV